MNVLEGLRCGIYNRCSTEEESQLRALETQAEESIEIVKKLGGIFVEQYKESETGTTTKSRKEFRRLVEDMKEGRFDCVVIKSADRLARNTYDWYAFLKVLYQNKLKLYTYLDNSFVNTKDPTITGLEALLAEKYSRDLSAKENNAHRRRQEKGSALILTKYVYGWKRHRAEDNKQYFSVVESEAAYIRKIFQMAAAGYGGRVIAMTINKEGAKTRYGNLFTDNYIRRMIRSTLYYGTVIMNKEHFDFNTKRTEKKPPEEWIYHENVLPAIVSKQLWQQANEEFDKRSWKKNDEAPQAAKPRYHLSGKIVCAECGAVYYRATHRIRDKQKVTWKCANYIQYGRKNKSLRKEVVRKVDTPHGCDNIHLDEDILFQQIENECEIQYEELAENETELIQKTVHLLERTLLEHDTDDNENTLKLHIEKLEKRKSALMDRMLDELITADEFKKKKSELDKKIGEIEKKLNQIQGKKKNLEAAKKRIEAIRDRLEYGDIMSKTSVSEMMDNISSIRVYPDGKLELYISRFSLTGLLNTVDSAKNETGDEKYNILPLQYRFVSEKERIKDENREKVYQEFVKNKNIQITEIMKNAGLSQNNVNLRIKELKEEGKIEYIGHGQWGHWRVCGNVKNSDPSRL